MDVVEITECFLRVPTSAFTFKTLLRHFSEQMLTHSIGRRESGMPSTVSSSSWKRPCYIVLLFSATPHPTPGAVLPLSIEYWEETIICSQWFCKLICHRTPLMNILLYFFVQFSDDFQSSLFPSISMEYIYNLLYFSVSLLRKDFWNQRKVLWC